MFRNLKVLSGGLKKVPTQFHLQLDRIDFPVNTRYLSLREDADTITLGTSINIVTVNKKGNSKSSTLKQAQLAPGSTNLCVVFNETFDFKATLFMESNGRAQEKIFRLLVNRISRIEGTNEFSSVTIGTVVIKLNEVLGSYEPQNFSLPIKDSNNSTIATLEIRLNKVDSGSDSLSDTSSVGSDLSFIHAETPKKSKAERIISRTIIGSSLPEASDSSGKRSPEVESMLAEVSILKMCVDRAESDKNNLSEMLKDSKREIESLKREKQSLLMEINNKDKHIEDYKQIIFEMKAEIGRRDQANLTHTNPYAYVSTSVSCSPEISIETETDGKI